MPTKYDVWLSKYGTEDEKDRRCGVGMFNLPRWFPMTQSCGFHDDGYSRLRRYALQAYQHTKIEKAIKALDTDGYWLKHIKLEDERFYKRMMGELESHPQRWLYKPIAKAFFSIVNKVGWCVWKSGTIKALKQMNDL